MSLIIHALSSLYNGHDSIFFSISSLNVAETKAKNKNKTLKNLIIDRLNFFRIILKLEVCRNFKGKNNLYKYCFHQP